MKYLSLTIPGTNGTPMQIDSGLPSGVPTGGIGTGMLNKIIVVFLEFAFIAAVIFCLYTILMGGINIIASEGDKKKFQSARDKIAFAIVGLIVVFMSIFLINLIGSFFGINLIGNNPSIPGHAPRNAN